MKSEQAIKIIESIKLDLFSLSGNIEGLNDNEMKIWDLARKARHEINELKHEIIRQVEAKNKEIEKA